MLRCSSSAPSLTTLAANYQPVDYDALSPAEQRDILQLQQSILESVVQEHDHRKVIESVCLLEEQLLPNAVATVMLLDHRRELNVYAAPSVPADKAAQLNGLKPGPHAYHAVTPCTARNRCLSAIRWKTRAGTTCAMLPSTLA
ncbi:hypothetical protein [Paludibacterium denitrificans]|uniref:hypothetical protein n=1 Tax=Paludibacterium denitrificans TaxID=2675226 RepID=UPI001E3368A1|nr:hypothetical protein [Paludibacterium denitrificans]